MKFFSSFFRTFEKFYRHFLSSEICPISELFFVLQKQKKKNQHSFVIFHFISHQFLIPKNNNNKNRNEFERLNSPSITQTLITYNSNQCRLRTHLVYKNTSYSIERLRRHSRQFWYFVDTDRRHFSNAFRRPGTPKQTLRTTTVAYDADPSNVSNRTANSCGSD